MKEHLLNLIFLQYKQEKQLDKLSEEEDADVYDAYVDILGVVLDIIGYPKDNTDKIGKIPDEEIISRDWFYQKLTDIALSTENEDLARVKIEDFYNWVSGETLEFLKKTKQKNDGFIGLN